MTHFTDAVERILALNLGARGVIDDRFFAAVRSRNRGGYAEQVGGRTTDEIVAVRTASPVVLFIMLAHRVIGVDCRRACTAYDCKD
jgi:hypothetical protein